jgi:hypothetical protein
MMTVFWDIAPCSLVEVDGRFSGAYCAPNGGRTQSETSVCFNGTTRGSIPEGYNLG